MKRLLLGSASFYMLCAVTGRVAERLGVTRCGCAATCWCQRPLLSVFRWVFAYRHTSAHPRTRGVEPA